MKKRITIPYKVEPHNIVKFVENLLRSLDIRYTIDDTHPTGESFTINYEATVSADNPGIIGNVYDLDMGGGCPTRVRPIEFLDNDRVLCEYLMSWPDRVESVSLKFFRMNGINV